MKTFSQAFIFVQLVAILHTSQGSSFSPAAPLPPGTKHPCLPLSCPPCPDEECPTCEILPPCELCPEIHIGCDCPFHHSCLCDQPACPPCDFPFGSLINKGGYRG
ncbi:small proline-rich protein 2B-like [Penaeus japonicus]|uniref:Stylicin protein n=1 Tax=Penaeus japonicus TaxID=27405 RepID=A0A142AS60_PENJP|nr:small proline-rich protein 2B-like [Penaeus japonicus]AMO44058.1 stylicin protein [Penaeus japonicus]